MAFQLLHEEVEIRSAQNEADVKTWCSNQDLVELKDYDGEDVSQVDNYLWRTSATDENIADTEGEITTSTPQPNKTQSQYAEMFCC